MSEPIKLSEIIEALEEEASRITTIQSAMVAAGMRAATDKKQMRKAACYQEAARMLALVAKHGKEISKIVKGMGNAV